MKCSTARARRNGPVAHALGHLDLHVEGQLVLARPGDQVQVAAHGPEKPLGGVEGGEFLGPEHAEVHQVATSVDAV
jgi:hypothetical protein